MTTSDYEKCARRIVDALQLSPGEKVALKHDARVFAPFLEPLRNLIRAAGADIGPFDRNTDVFIWLPELDLNSQPVLNREVAEWLDAGHGRSVHFHWQSGSYPIDFLGLPAQDVIDRIYLNALDVSTTDLARKHARATGLLRSGPVRVTTPEGTDITFEIGDRPFCSQIGDASRARMKSAGIRIDREVELPAGVLRVAPIEASANGSIFLPVWRPVASKGRNLLLRFVNGHVVIEGVNADNVDQELTAAGGDARMFREFALGFNPVLKVLPEAPFIGYFGYGSGVVRLSLGDNQEMGGTNRGGGVYWNFFHNATVTAGDHLLVKDGKLTAAVDA